MKIKIIILYSIISISWGITWLFLKINVTEMPILWSLSIRFIIAGGIFWSLYFFQEEKVKYSPEIMNIYLVYSIFNFTLGYVLTYWATQYVYSNLGAIFWSLSPLFIALMAHMTLPDDKINLKKIFSLSLGIIGTLLILYNRSSFGQEKVHWAMIALLLAVISGSWPSVYLKKHRIKINSFHLNACGLSLSGIIILILSIIFEKGQLSPLTSSSLFSLSFLILPGTVVTWGIYIWLLNHLAASQLSYIAFFPPVIAIITGWIFLDESLTIMPLIGAFLIILGGFIINYNFKVKGYD